MIITRKNNKRQPKKATATKPLSMRPSPRKDENERLDQDLHNGRNVESNRSRKQERNAGRKFGRNVGRNLGNKFSSNFGNKFGSKVDRNPGRNRGGHPGSNARWLLSVMLLTMAVIAFLSMGIGTIYVNPVETILILLGADSPSTFIVENYRLPRAIIAILAGAGFAVSGVILQAIIRNPLVSPDVVGVTNGAGLFAVIAIVLFPAAPSALLPIAAFIGAAIVAIVLMMLSSNGGMQPSSLALIGIAIGAVCQAITEYFLVKFPLQANDSLVWLAGSLYGRGWPEVYGLLPWLIVLLPISLLLYRRMDLLGLNHESVIGLGLSVKRTRYTLLALAVALAGACVATVGSIGFIGLIAPHIARRLFGNRHIHLLPGAILTGATILLIADALGRTIRPPLEIPAGILTAIIGVPYFLWLVRREKSSAQT